jgi:NAD(P)H-nitrite reductase large subunit
VAGAWLDTDLVVVAIGIDPRSDLARNAGLTTTSGIAVNGQLQLATPRVRGR